MHPINEDPHRVVFRQAMEVRWGDMDAFNHVNNAAYLCYLEEARVQWLEGLAGISLSDRIGPVLAASQLNYRKPIKWPSEIMVELLVDKVGNRSLTLGHRIASANAPGLLYSDGSVVMVWVDTQTGASVLLPDAVRMACGAAAGTGPAIR